ncbi:phosphoribosyltransferase family protein [Halobacillus rhizosphaerae]|uniref:phosphoribosyltransferase family protein n=1 Tax=Halobacillus rhizosphaerae TaxID=3064889 RepID=UPI00398AA16D
MKNTATSTYSPNKETYMIMNNMKVELQIKDNPFQLPLEALFTMAARVNKKRAFLFVSNLLGKHVPVHPIVPLFTSGLLALHYFQEKEGKSMDLTDVVEDYLSNEPERLHQGYMALRERLKSYETDAIIIGFAETATALGHGVYDGMEGSSYVHTTREEIPDVEPVLTFEEEHSHAVDQRCLANEEFLATNQPVILVDDEISTGKTALNIIDDIHTKHPRKDYTILSILDWRTEEHREAFSRYAAEMEINIHCYSLLSGVMSFEGESLSTSSYDYEIPNDTSEQVKVNWIDLSSWFRSEDCLSSEQGNSSVEPGYIHETGRFGLAAQERDSIEAACQSAGDQLKLTRTEGSALCLGTGELMYIPMKIASMMGEDVHYHSSTRSPIHPIDKEGYAIRNGCCYANPEDSRVLHYLYNIPSQQYEELYFFIEKPVENRAIQPIVELCKNKGISNLNVVSFSKGSVDQ